MLPKATRPGRKNANETARTKQRRKPCSCKCCPRDQLMACRPNSRLTDHSSHRTAHGLRLTAVVNCPLIHSPLPTTHGSQLTAHAHTVSSQPTQFTAPIVHGSQLTAHSPPPTTHRPQLTTHNSQLTTHGSRLTYGSQLTAHTATAHTAQLTAYI